jgi:signal transduction histidine kinase/ligand-binding sensor domain-containing protein
VVTALWLDRTGLLWIGSRDGLLLFDGQTLRTFEYDVSDPESISDNAIRTIYEDRQGYLWIGTNSGGLNRLDRAQWRFQRFRHEPSDPGTLSNDSVYAVLEDRAGFLWVGTQQGLNRYNPKTRTFHRFTADSGDPAALASDYILALCEDRAGRLWVGTLGGGLSRWDPERGTFTSFRNSPQDPLSLSDDRVGSILEDPAGTLWVGTVRGLNRMDSSDGSFRRFPASGEGPLVKALAPGRVGTLWIGTHTGGLQELDEKTGELRAWGQGDAGRPALGSDQVEALLADSAGALWIGTWGGGLRRISPSAQLLSDGRVAARIPARLKDEGITSFLIDRQGGIWYGSSDLWRLNSADGSLRHFPLEARANSPMRSVLAMIEDHAGRIWAGTSLDLVRLDGDSGKAIYFRHDPHDPASIGPGYVRAVLEGRTGELWIGTGEGGVQRLDASGRVMIRFVRDPNRPDSLSDNYVTALYEDSEGTLWVGTRSGGLNALDTASGRITRYLPDPGDPHSLSHHCVTSLLGDRHGRLWVATAGGGLNRVEKGSLQFQRTLESDGLVDNDVMAILEDDDGSLWLSTRRGIARFDPTTSKFLSIQASDGLPSAEFETGSAARSSRILYFGSVKGPVAVPAGTAFPRLLPSPMIVTSIRTPAGEVRGSRPVWDMDRLELPYGEWLSLELVVLDYSPEHRHRYAYRLKGKWVDLGPSGAITFTGLEPGVHRFAARGRNSEGVWSRPTADLRIEVVPPWWMTGWFRGSAVLAVVAVALIGHRLRLSSVERRNRELVALHDQRERARKELTLAYERLLLLTGRLEAAKEDERQRIARELHDELGPSLTAVIINLQLLARNPSAPSSLTKIPDAINMVDQLVQRVRDLSLDLRPPLLDELGLSAALRGYLETQSERTGLDIPVEVGAGVEGLPPEIEIHAFRVVQEAVTNAVRHADASRVQVKVECRNNDLILAVKDDGKGFDVSKTLGSFAGKSLGLLGMTERIRSLGGEIVIDSSAGRGTEIRARIPFGAAR